jgi:hypothetical protein
MSKVKQMDWDGKGTKAWRFWCPGCEGHHAPIEGRWTFNGDCNRPTFSPSILVRGTRFTEKGEVEYEKWRVAGFPMRKEVFDSIPSVCHSFVTDGRIRYLGDCTHSLAGQTVDLPDLEE